MEGIRIGCSRGQAKRAPLLVDTMNICGAPESIHILMDIQHAHVWVTGMYLGKYLFYAHTVLLYLILPSFLVDIKKQVVIHNYESSTLVLLFSALFAQEVTGDCNV